MINQRLFLRDLQEALQKTEGQGSAARHQAIQAVMSKHGATADDVARLLGRARQQQRRELSGLASRLTGLIARREEMESTVAAVEEFLRAQQR